jgi:hypothetical protein
MKKVQELNKRFNALSIQFINVYHDLIVDVLYTIDSLASEDEDFTKELEKLDLIVKSAELLQKAIIK